jgi:hypothetical protein
MCGKPFGTLHLFPRLLSDGSALFLLSEANIPDLLCSYREKLLRNVGDTFDTACIHIMESGGHGLVFTKDVKGKVRDPQALLKSVRSDFVLCAEKAFEEASVGP